MPTRLDYIEREVQDSRHMARVTAADILNLVGVARAAQDEHGGRHYETECPICVALAPLLAERGAGSARDSL